MSEDFFWPEECARELKALTRRGFSANQIAKTLNKKFGTDYTRAAVCTKILRSDCVRKSPSAPRRIEHADYTPNTIDTHPLQLIKNITRRPEQSA